MAQPDRGGRLTTPMVREGDRLVPASWEHALDRAADGLRRARDDHGPDAVGMFSCSKATNEVNYVAQKFMRVAIGTNNIDSCNRT
jgi:predicted molibdopterin-dependent oxidoreductase YjgC